jgi:retron-type reverse transcriptase
MSLQLLKSASSLHGLAGILSYKPKGLSFVLYVRPQLTRYTTFEIAKRSGGKRTIQAPEPELRQLQKKVSDLLQNCIEEIKQKKGWHDQLSHGFKRGRSIISNATVHRRKRYVFNIDLQDFFPSINFGRVYGFFLKDRNFELHPKVATILTQIACYQGGLPQGSPCSPVISNLVAHILDIRLCRIAQKTGCTYSRYADDITFSTNKRAFPKEVAECIGNSHEWRVGKQLEQAITSAGFSINPSKTRMQYCDSRQNVTGLVVNTKVNIRSEYRRTVRAMAHHLFQLHTDLTRRSRCSRAHEDRRDTSSASWNVWAYP